MAKKNNEPEIFEELDLDVDVQLQKTEDFVQKNKNILAGIVGLIAILVLGGYFLKVQKEEAEVEAQLSVFPAQYYFGLDSLDLVLNGDGNQVIGVEEIAETYSGTKAGNLANFYAGVAHMKQGDFETAIEYLEAFSSSDLLVQSRAYSLTGDAYMELNDLEQAKANYQKACSNNPTKQYTPRYLLKLALAYEKSGELPEAINTYDKLITDYYSSEESTKARKYKAFLQAKVDSE